MLDLVTGGAGFIGSHLTDRLLAQGRTVRVVDNMASGNPRNLEQQKANPNLELRVADVADPAAMAEAMKGVERVFHLAALADIVPSIQNPEGYFRSNVVGTFVTLQAARAANVRRLRLCRLLLVLRHPRFLSDAGSRRDPAAISLCFDQMAGRMPGHALGAGLWTAGAFASLLQHLWTARAHQRNLRRGFWRIPCTASRRQAADHRRRRRANA